MRDEVNQRQTLLQTTQTTVQSDVLAFNKQLTKYQTIVSNNAVLIYIKSTVSMTDLKLADFTTQIQALPPPVDGNIVLNLLEGAVELIDAALVLKFVVNLGKLAKNKWWPKKDEPEEGDLDDAEVEELGEESLDSGLVSEEEASTAEPLEDAEEVGEEVTETVIEDSTSAALASTGVGIFAAVALDVVFSAINGAKEKAQLQAILDQIDDKMKIVNTYLTTVTGKVTEVNTKTVAQITLFKNIATGMYNLLPAGHKPTFITDFPDTLDSLDTCLSQQALAISQYSILMQLRVDYINAKRRNPQVTKSTVIGITLDTCPLWVTQQMLEDMWDQVLAKYSTEMTNAS